ncbi:MAG: hypothetical protein LBQ82_08735 [Treponema sp.]|jgi:hypothetical protein|nr:hypothetical protein [Treponema sp.]
MNRSLRLFSAIFLFTLSIPIHAEDPQPAGMPSGNGMMPGLRRRAVVLDIDARVLEQKNEVVWSETHRKLTIPGNPVGIKLVGSNLVVAVQFTPFISRRGNVLVAQGQIWIDDPEKGMCYYTSIQTIPLVFGEPIYFFPLGPQQINSSIEIILTVNPNNAPSSAETTSDSKDDN